MKLSEIEIQHLNTELVFQQLSQWHMYNEAQEQERKMQQAEADAKRESQQNNPKKR